MVKILQEKDQEVRILTSVYQLEAQLLNIELAGRTCYQSYIDPMTKESASKFIRMLIKSGHESVLEHSLITVRISGCSRGLTHELVRHRHTAFSQESTRYVDESDLHFKIPPNTNEMDLIVGDPDGECKVSHTLYNMVDIIEDFYQCLLLADWKPEDARQFLPIGTISEIVFSCSFRQLRQMFKLRTDINAHWEIRSVFCNLMKQIKEIIPMIVEDFYYAGADGKGGHCYTQKTQETIRLNNEIGELQKELDTKNHFDRSGGCSS